MHDELWAGVESKLENSAFHLDRMGQSLQPPERTHMNAALEASGVILTTNWQRALYAHLDAFLSTTRSVPEIINCCFGQDSSQQMKSWFDKLSPDEQDRRRDFSKQFKANHVKFRAHDLSQARHVSEHRKGYAPVEVAIKGFFGVVYTGSPVKPVPTSETRVIDNPEYAFLAKPMPLRPSWQDFTIDGKPLFDECGAYLERARTLIAEARTISAKVHGNKALMPPA